MKTVERGKGILKKKQNDWTDLRRNIPPFRKIRHRYGYIEKLRELFRWEGERKRIEAELAKNGRRTMTLKGRSVNYPPP